MVGPVYFAESEESGCVVCIDFKDILLENVRFVCKEVKGQLIVEPHWIGESKAIIDGICY